MSRVQHQIPTIHQLFVEIDGQIRLNTFSLWHNRKIISNGRQSQLWQERRMCRKRSPLFRSLYHHADLDIFQKSEWTTRKVEPILKDTLQRALAHMLRLFVFLAIIYHHRLT